jgi:hypothetical protein
MNNGGFASRPVLHSRFYTMEKEAWQGHGPPNEKDEQYPRTVDNPGTRAAFYEFPYNDFPLDRNCAETVMCISSRRMPHSYTYLPPPQIHLSKILTIEI